MTRDPNVDDPGAGEAARRHAGGEAEVDAPESEAPDQGLSPDEAGSKGGGPSDGRVRLAEPGGGSGRSGLDQGRSRSG